MPHELIYRVLRQNQAHLQHNAHQGQQNGGQNDLEIERYRKTVSTALWVKITLEACYLFFASVAAVIFFYGSLPNLAWHPPLSPNI